MMFRRAKPAPVRAQVSHCPRVSSSHMKLPPHKHSRQNSCIRVKGIWYTKENLIGSTGQLSRGHFWKELKRSKKKMDFNVRSYTHVSKNYCVRQIRITANRYPEKRCYEDYRCKSIYRRAWQELCDVENLHRPGHLWTWSVSYTHLTLPTKA